MEGGVLMHWEITPLLFDRARIIWTDGRVSVEKGY